MAFFGISSKTKLGIDIGTASIKIVELAKEAGRFKLENYGLAELASGKNEVSQSEANQASQLLDQAIAAGIKEVLRVSKMKSREAVASIASFNTFATIITLPYLSEQDIAKAIPFEARKYIPLPLSEVVLDWSIVNVVPASTVTGLAPSSISSKPPTVEVFIAAVSKDETQRYQDIMKQAGVELKALELENFALIRGLVGNDLSPIAVVNIGGRSTSILVVDGGFERVSHNYEIGGFEITKSIARSLNISLARAEELKRNLGQKGGQNDAITSAMSSLVELIVSEARKIIHNYEDIKKAKITKVLLVGGLANMPVFMEYFTNKLGLPVSLGNPLSRTVYNPRLEPLKKELNSTFAVALGLGMRNI